jgi:glycosyltransferase involved in cell wall biosynthesis
MNPIRILVILEAKYITGPARNLIAFVPLAKNAGIETIFATFLRKERSNIFTEELKNLSIPIFGLDEESAYDPSIIQKLKHLVKEVKPELIETHAVKSHFLTRVSGLHNSIPWVAFHHGYTSTTWRTDLYNELDRWSLKAAAQVVTVSKALLEQLRAKGIETEKVKVIHNAVPSTYCTEMKDPSQIDALRSELGIPYGRKVILSVGRLSKEKDQISIVEALGELQDSSPPYLLLVGEGPEKKAILEKSSLLGIKDRVILAGHQEYVAPFYALADVFVISSSSEGSPNVLLEALAAGVPVVATAVGGIPEMVTDGVHALLVQHRNPKHMANSIKKILGSADLAKSLVKNGKMLILDRFSPEERAQTLSEMYVRILKSNS